MKLLKRLFTAALALALTVSLSTALAAEGDLFPVSVTYPGFADIAKDGTAGGPWYDYNSVVLCTEAGLMRGTGNGFAPGSAFSIAEVATVAALVNEITTGYAIPANLPNQPWYAPYLLVMAHIGVSLPADPTVPASRTDFVRILSAVLPDRFAVSINAIAALPDSGDKDVLRFYNAGIVAGVDKYGTFAGDKGLTRAEGAAMLARIVRPSLRSVFIPADYRPFTAANWKPSDILFSGSGKSVTAEVYLNAVTALIADLEAQCTQSGLEFNWLNMVEGVTFLEYVKQSSLSNLAVTKDMGTALYENFDLQVFYSRLIDLKGLTA